MERRGSTWVVLLSVTTLLSFFAPVSAFATGPDCTHEQTLFVKRPNVGAGEGVITINTVRVVTLDDCSAGQADRHSTAHLRAADGYAWVEVGWQQIRSGGVDSWDAFWEWGDALNANCDPVTHICGEGTIGIGPQ